MSKSTLKKMSLVSKQKDFSLNKVIINMFKISFMIWEVYAVLQHSTSKTGLCCTCLRFFVVVFFVYSFCLFLFVCLFFLLGNNSEILCRLPRSRIKDPLLYQKESFHHSITKYDEVTGKSAKTNFRFFRAKFIQATAECVIPWPYYLWGLSKP